MIYVFIGAIFVVVYWLIDWSYKAKEESTDVVKTSLEYDFQHTCSSIESSPYDADWYIDQFEQRWVSYLTHKELKKYIGMLIAKQVQYA